MHVMYCNELFTLHGCGMTCLLHCMMFCYITKMIVYSECVISCIYIPQIWMSVRMEECAQMDNVSTSMGAFDVNATPVSSPLRTSRSVLVRLKLLKRLKLTSCYIFTSG